MAGTKFLFQIYGYYFRFEHMALGRMQRQHQNGRALRNPNSGFARIRPGCAGFDQPSQQLRWKTCQFISFGFMPIPINDDY